MSPLLGDSDILGHADAVVLQRVPVVKVLPFPPDRTGLQVPSGRDGVITNLAREKLEFIILELTSGRLGGLVLS